MTSFTLIQTDLSPVINTDSLAWPPPPSSLRDLGLDDKTWLFNNPNDIVPTIPVGYWVQVRPGVTLLT